MEANNKNNNRRGRNGSADAILKALVAKGVATVPSTLTASVSAVRTASIVQIEVNGEKTHATVVKGPTEQKSYTLAYTDKNGKTVTKDVTKEVDDLFKSVEPETVEIQ